MKSRVARLKSLIIGKLCPRFLSQRNRAFRGLLTPLLVALLVFVSFLVGGFLVFKSSYDQVVMRAEEAVEAAAWQAASKLGFLEKEPEQSQVARERLLRGILERESMVESIELIVKGPEGPRLFASAYQDGGGPLLDSIVLPETLDLLKELQVLDVNGRVIATAPILGGGYMLASARCPGLLEWLRRDSHGLISYLTMAVCASALSGLLLHFSNRRFQKAFCDLAEAEQRLRDVADAAGEYSWEVDSDGHFIFLSERVKDVLGWEARELLGKHPFELLLPGTRAAIEARSKAIVAARQSFRDFEHMMQRKDGSAIWLSVNGVPVLDRQGGLVGYRGAALDITSRKNFEQALVKEKEAAQAATIAKSQFLAMMSHEIRTPLNSVLGFAEILSKSPLGPEQREYLQQIRASSQALLELLNDILEFSRSEILRETSMNPVPTDIRELAASALALHRPVAENKRVQLGMQAAPDVPQYLLLDSARLRQVLLNLVGNAVKFTDAGSVELRLERGQAAPLPGKFPLRIVVKDTGVGIPVEKRPLLFQPFSQIDSGPTRRHGGTGLGLVICRRLAEVFGGVVFLEDSGSQGSTFVFECQFPVGRAPQDSKGFRAKAEWPQGWSPRILIAEDNPPSRKLLRAMLQNLGLSCQEAVNGKEAIEKHHSSPFEIIFMDLQMPEVDGLSATQAIRTLEAAGKVPPALIVALTADAFSGDREKCLQAGMNDYLSKPLRRDELVAALHRASQRRASSCL